MLRSPAPAAYGGIVLDTGAPCDRVEPGSVAARANALPLLASAPLLASVVTLAAVEGEVQSIAIAPAGPSSDDEVEEEEEEEEEEAPCGACSLIDGEVINAGEITPAVSAAAPALPGWRRGSNGSCDCCIISSGAVRITGPPSKLKSCGMDLAALLVTARGDGRPPPMPPVPEPLRDRGAPLPIPPSPPLLHVAGSEGVGVGVGVGAGEAGVPPLLEQYAWVVEGAPPAPTVVSSPPMPPMVALLPFC